MRRMRLGGATLLVGNFHFPNVCARPGILREASGRPVSPRLCRCDASVNWKCRVGLPPGPMDWPRPYNRQVESSLRPVDRTRDTVAAEITRNLLSYLLSGKIVPGERIPSERNLSEALGVGRSVVREALKSLTVLGLIDVRQGDGTFLKRTDSELLPQTIEWGLVLGAKKITDLVEARYHLEVLLAGLAAERRDDESLAEMRRQVGIMERAGSPEDFVAADMAFHYAVAAASGNQSLLQIMKSIRALMQVWIGRVMQSPDSSRPTWEEHAAVLEAIASQDPSAARHAMDRHMEGATRRLEHTIEAHGASLTAEPVVGPTR
jgi:GntR family transcriptional repressor for pyruvate dehydrogenase complex